MKIVITLSAFLILMQISLKAQTAKVFGYVIDSLTGESLIGANVVVIEKNMGVSSNNFGFYSLPIKANTTLQISVSYVGYETKKINLNLNSDSTINLKLIPTTLQEVVIKTEKTRAEHGQITVPIERLKVIPSLAGEPDILKALTFLPGVSAGAEGTTGLYVRGGTPDQNLILLDGGKVYNTSHLFGFISVFDPSALKSVTLYKGGFPARFGGRLSSVIDITMKEGNNQKRESEFTLGLLNSGFRTEGPILKNKSSYMFSGRTAYSGLLTLPTKIGYNRGGEDFADFFIYDVNAKINFDLSKNEKLFVSAYLGKDIFESGSRLNAARDDNRGQGKWGNETVSLRYTKVIKSNLFASLLMNYNNYVYSVSGTSTSSSTGQLLYDYNKISKVTEYSAKLNFDWQLGSSSVKFGTEVNQNRFEPNSLQLVSYSKSDTSKKTNAAAVYQPLSLSLYAEATIPLGKKVNFNLGARTLNYFVDANIQQTFEPRFLMSYRLSDNTTLEGSFTKMAQNVHLLTTSTISLPNDIWVPSTAQAPLEKAWQIALSATETFNATPYSLQLEGFYKSMNNLIDYKDGVDVFNFEKQWDKLIEANGIGRAYGAEIFLRKDYGRFNGWLSYTLSWSERKFANINNGNWFAQHYDRRHNLDIVAQYKISNRWTFNANFVLQTGYAITLPDLVYVDIAGIRREFYTSRNNARAPLYHRLDISFSKTYKTKHGNEARWTYSVYNVYAHANPFSVDFIVGSYDNTPQDLGYTGTTRVHSIFNFVPGVSYSLKFK